MRAYERLLKYVKFDTQSSEDSGAHPSTKKQLVLAEALKQELAALGASDITLTDKGYLTAKVPATEGFRAAPAIGFIAHMDTSPDFSGEGVDPIIWEDYDGGTIPLGDSGLVLSPEVFPHLTSLKGRTLITTDGRTLLGADDKAGIAEIMTALERIRDEKIPHGRISLGFTPDEEIGEGADYFDVESFGAELAYTADGGAEGSLEYENFNAAAAEFEIVGASVHPGSAKGKMINASLVAMEINSLLPGAEIPSLTEGYEGFYHLTGVESEVSHGRLSYIVRDHDRDLFEARLKTLRHVEKVMNEKYGEGTVTLTLRHQYRNMREMVEPHMHVIHAAEEAIRQAGLTPTVEPIRGGTDGARLSFMGLPCPNLGTGGFAFHGPYEHITAEGMDLATDILLGIVKIYANKTEASE